MVVVELCYISYSIIKNKKQKLDSMLTSTPSTTGTPQVVVQIPTATPLDVPPAHNPASSTGHASSATVTYATPVDNVIVGESEDFGICRRCRQPFRRPPGVNDGQASYYRCAACEAHRGVEIFDSCNVL
jgi:hypothetical protein